MKTGEWERVNEITADALELTASHRRAFLDRTCANAPALRREVESLLAAEAEAEDFFGAPAVLNYADFFIADREDAESRNGQQIGNYRVLKELGRGGMGVVYLAERIDGKFAQTVAVKILNRELNTEDFRRNFNREKEILAKLSHPHIARLLDAGTTADGVPFLAMEYIEGLPIDAFCRDNRLDLKQRLKLFIRVCEAVACAHRNLIVHRDLKPSNIIVTADGTPKLLDFGISKLLDAPANPEQPPTILGALTPYYASPEQIRGEAVSTATDVYSLGVVLFKMLTGKFPYNFRSQADSQIFRTITDDEPTLPSKSLREAETRKEETAKENIVADESRSAITKSTVAASQLKGDLDNIILKAISKNPERRYQSVEQFSADIWRFTDGLPVLARPATFSYRARKFYRRHQIPVLAGMLVFLSLVVGIVASISQMREAREQARFADEARLATEREIAHTKAEQEKSEKISRFVARIVSYANPAWYAEGSRFKGEAKVIDALEDLGDKIDEEFAGQADVQSELHHKFGEAYSWASQNQTDAERQRRFQQKSKFHILRAYELRKQFYGEWHELVAKDIYYVHYQLANDERGRAELMAKAIVMMRDTNPRNINFPYMLDHYAARLITPDKSDVHEIYRQAAVSATAENKYALAERYLREAMPVYRLHYKEENSAVVFSECLLAYTLAMQDKWTDFDQHYQICKQPHKDGKGVELSRLEMVEKVLAEKKYFSGNHSEKQSVLTR